MSWLNKLLRREDPAQFGRMMVKHFAGSNPGSRLVFDLQDFRINFLNAEEQVEHTFFLNNIYSEYKAASFTARPAVIKNYPAAAINLQQYLPESFAEAAPMLLPRILPRADWENYSLFFQIESLSKKADSHDGKKAEGKSHRFTYVPFTDFYAIGVCIDTPKNVLYVDTDRIRDWKVTFDEAISQGKQNLLKISPEPAFDLFAPGVHISTWHDTYDTSRLILTDLIRALPVTGTHVAMLPNRNALIVTGSEDHNGLNTMLDAAEQLATQPRAMPTIPIFLVGDQWREYDVPPHHPLFGRLKKQRIMAQSQNYTSQGQNLTLLLQKMNDETFVSTYMAFEKNGRLMTMATWSKGVRALLPRAEYIGLTDEGGIVAAAKWEKVCEITGDMLQPTDYFPERYLVTDFPDDDQIRKIGNELKNVSGHL